MLYLVRTGRPAGYLFHGKIVQRRDNATHYTSPSAAARAIAQAQAAGITARLTAVAVKPSKRTSP